MKKALIIGVVVLAVLFASNPGLATHKAALLEKEIAGLPEAGLDANSPFIIKELSTTVEQRTGRKDYGLFSITTVNYSDTLPDSSPKDLLNREVGIGLLGRVYLWSAM